MDHKVSKDMISSGMIPSGEKTQADLGRIQYGSNPSPSSLADAYKSIYEHHQKDKDGNTIPHEGEELNEVAPLLAAPLVAKGLMALKGAKVGAAALKGAAAFKKGLMTAKGAAAAGKITTTGGKVLGGAKKVGMAQKAGSAVRSAGAAIKNNPMSTALVATSLKPGPKMPSGIRDPRAKMTGARTAGVYASADLFDIVKGQLLDEGIDEKDALKIMVELSQQDLNTIVNEGIGKITLGQIAGGAAKLGAVAAGGALAHKAIKKGKEASDDAINKARDKGFGGNTRPGADKVYFGK